MGMKGYSPTDLLLSPSPFNSFSFLHAHWDRNYFYALKGEHIVFQVKSKRRYFMKTTFFTLTLFLTHKQMKSDFLKWVTGRKNCRGLFLSIGLPL